jgi:hypothetical protein
MYSPRFPAGPTGPVPNFYSGTPRDVPMFAPGIMTAQGEVSAAVEKGGVSVPVQPSYQPQYQINMKPVYQLLAFIALLVAALLVLTAMNTNAIGKLKAPDAKVNANAATWQAQFKPPTGTNTCAGKQDVVNADGSFDDSSCLEATVDEQAAADVSSPFIGTKTTDAEPILTSYWQAGLCPVNVHWHIGAEHRSAGQFDEDGTGPTPYEWDGKGRAGLRCKHYKADDPKFTTAYPWQHCKHMQVGETYEVHWPHSALGACGTINQYQTPFYDGVLCNPGRLTSLPQQIGVQSQTYTIVNDEAYYYPDLFRGMIVDGEFGKDMVFYTGSTTGDKRNNNDKCSKYTPITWQVDRKCHMISASTFDKMCAEMKAQRDDMSYDLHPHGAREVVSAALTANNMKAGSMTGGTATFP